ncbi:MAG: response regulator [Deltaproteobacteria bacterium]|jgi:CheY-like chemotaxis protein|nr:response regulator [Candidatus Kapabacteria bacterium]
MSLKPRILLIEDDPERIATFRSWLNGSEFVLIEASSGGRAAGILKKGMTDGIAGVCLDNDLEKQPVTQADLSLSGSALVNAIAQSVPRYVPILIHSMNAHKPVSMEKSLKSAGFSVTRIRMAILTRKMFNEWLEEVQDNWDDMISDM